MTVREDDKKMRTSLRKWLGSLKFRVQDEGGLGLVESLAAIAILGVSVVAFVVALSSGSITVREGGQESVAQSLVQTQLEYIKSYPYDTGATTYPTVEAPEGYTISVAVTPIPNTDTDIQKITVTISREGGDILEIEDYKVNR